MGYLTRDDFLRLVEIVRPSSHVEQVKVLEHRLTEMDHLMAQARQIEGDGDEVPEELVHLMSEKWVALTEFARACVYLLHEEKQRPTVTSAIQQMIKESIEAATGEEIRIVEFREMTEEEYNQLSAQGGFTSEVAFGELGEADENPMTLRPNPFFQADGRTYPADGEQRERGIPGQHRANRLFGQAQNPVPPDTSGDLEGAFGAFIRSLDQDKEKPVPPTD